jgi:hypothetical protein
MGLNDTFDFDEYAYARAISDQDEYTTHRLKTQEVVKFRQHISSSASIGGGIGLAPFTFGLSLLGTAYGARRLYIAKKKLEMIEAELKKREVALHTPTKRDFFIPFGISVATMGLGAGVDAVASHATSQVASHVVADHGVRSVSDVIQSPGSFCHGVGEGLSLQAHELSNVVTGGLQHATAISNWDASYIMAGAPYAIPGEVVGLAGGIALAHLTEAKIAQYASGKIAMCTIDRVLPRRSQPFTYAALASSCRRKQMGSGYLQCSVCKTHFNTMDTPYFR